MFLFNPVLLTHEGDAQAAKKGEKIRENERK